MRDRAAIGRPAEITGYDRWIDRRLSTGQDESWLGHYAIDVAANICTLLGDELVQRLPSEGGEPTLRIARAEGYDVACRGPEAISETLHRLAGLASGPQDFGRVAFGRFYDVLASISIDDARYDPFRVLLRDVMLDVWPVDPGTILLGRKVEERRLHSVGTAAADVGIKEPLMRRLLIAEGFVDVGDPRPDARLTFPAQGAGLYLAMIARLVSSTDMRTRLGASAQQFETLVRAGAISPRFPPAVTRRAWDPQDADALLADLTYNAQRITQSDAGWEHLHHAAGRIRVDVGEVLSAVREGTVRAGVRDDLDGYAGIFVRMADADAALRPGSLGHRTMSDFAAEIGLLEGGHFRRLAERGHTPMTVAFNPKTRRQDRFVSDRDAEAFHERFTTARVLARSLGVDARNVGRRLRAAGIAHFLSGDIAFGPVYLVADVEPILRKWKAQDREG